MSAILYAIRMFWTRTVDCFSDPIRWRHLVWRGVEGYVGGAVAVGLLRYQLGVIPRGGWQWAAVVTVPLAGVVAEYLVYEYLIEPWARMRVRAGKPSTAGPYFERGPRDGEAFRYE